MVVDGGGIPPLPWTEEFLHTQAGNGPALSGVGGILSLWAIVWLICRTSFLIAVGSTLMLIIAAHLFIVVLLVLVALMIIAACVASENSKKTVVIERRRY